MNMVNQTRLVSIEESHHLQSILKDSANRGKVKLLRYHQNPVKIIICFISKRNKTLMEKTLKIFGMLLNKTHLNFQKVKMRYHPALKLIKATALFHQKT
jgi:uncharacterized protein YjhX (UPF0386 family)